MTKKFSWVGEEIKMSQQFYRILAEELKNVKKNIRPNHNSDDIYERFCEAITDVFLMENPKFDRYKFLEACGINE